MLKLTDGYKLSHRGFEEPNTEFLCSNWTPRSANYFPKVEGYYDNKVVSFGIQMYIKKYMIKEAGKFFKTPKKKAIKKFKKLVDSYLGEGKVDMGHFEALHDLGYMPLEIMAIPEGLSVPIGIPHILVYNTVEHFEWLVNYYETLFSCEMWKPSTIATIAKMLRKICDDYAMKTVGNTDHVMFQCHDFSFRGHTCLEDAIKAGMGHLMFFKGTDTLPSIAAIQDLYKGTGFIGTSIPASEHSIASLGYAVRGEIGSFIKWISEDYPVGGVSLVSDTTDYWKVMTDYLVELKPFILARKPDPVTGLNKVVFRPDSGNPFRIICGYMEYEVTRDTNSVAWYKGKALSDAEFQGSLRLLDKVFGHTMSVKGYKMIDSHVGLIYGDSINPGLMVEILDRMAEMGYASSNVVFGIGSFTYAYMTRDTLGWAVKATWAQVAGKPVELCKNPVTDSGVKRSLKGIINVNYDPETGNWTCEDQQKGLRSNVMNSVFKDGYYSETTWYKVINNTQLK